MKQLTKSIFIACIGILASLTAANAQISTPAPSPFSKIEQRVGLTDVSISYSRPSMRERKIFGGLLDYGAVWRTGANQSTKISFSDDVKLGGKEIPAGEYAIYTMPGKEMWTVMIYKDLSLGGGVANYKKENELTRFTVKPQELPFAIETMTFMINDIKDDGANIYLMWEKTMIAMELDVEVESRVMAAIDRTMAGPSANDYFQAAVYYYNNDKDLDKALGWINKSLESNEAFWIMTWKSRIQAKKGDVAGAIKTSEKAIELAEKAKNADYVKMNKEMIAEYKSKM